MEYAASLVKEKTNIKIYKRNNIVCMELTRDKPNDKENATYILDFKFEDLENLNSILRKESNN